MFKFSHSRIVCAVVVIAVAFQTSDLTRFVYTWFGLAPDCPVVGVESHSGTTSCHASQRCHGTAADESSTPQQERSEEPSDDERRCRTCQMFATAHTVGTVLLSVTVLFDHVATDCRDAVDGLLALEVFAVTHARAPPPFHTVG